MDWSGVFPSVVTPFDTKGHVDPRALERHLKFMLDAGVHGLIVASTLGECGTLDTTEKLEIVARSVEVASGYGVPVVAAVVGFGLDQEQVYLAALKSGGASGVLVFPPVLYRPSAEELIDHMRRVIDAAELPAMVFNKPSTFGCDFSPAVARGLADHPLWQGVKEAAELTARVPAWRASFGTRCAVFAGDEFALEALALGANGFVAGLGNVVPAESVALYEACVGGRFERAQELYKWLAPIYQLDVSPQLVQNIKLAASMVNGFPEAFRHPRLPIEGEAREHVKTVVERAAATRPHLR